MREIRIGDKEIRVRATPLALLYYKQAFRADLIGDMIEMVKSIGLERIASGINMENMDEMLGIVAGLDIVTLLQIAWAMAKADAFGQHFPSFETWISELENVDLSDPSFLIAAMEEAASGFLGGGGKPGPRK